MRLLQRGHGGEGLLAVDAGPSRLAVAGIKPRCAVKAVHAGAVVLARLACALVDVCGNQ